MGEIRFDPYTGEPVAPKKAAAPQTPPAPETPKKKKKGGILAGIIAAVVIVGGIFAVTKCVNVPGTPYEQIKEAAENTFVSAEENDDLTRIREIMGDGVYAADGSFDVDGQEVKLEFDTDKGNLSAKLSAAGLDGTVYMDDKKVTVDASELGLGILSYNYASDKADKADSYLGSMVGTENLKTVDMFIKLFHSVASMDKDRWNEVREMIDEKGESLEFEEVRQETGAAAEWYGYATVVSGEFLADLFDDASEIILGKSLTDLSDELESLGISADDGTGVLDRLREMEDIELTVYTGKPDKGKKEVLKQIDIKGETDDQDIDLSLQFEGDDVPWYHTALIDNNTSFGRFVIDCDTDGVDFHFCTSEGIGILDASLVNGEDAVTVELRDAEGKYIDGEIEISDECNVAKAPAAEDILNMSQDDFNRLAEMISRLMYGF